VYGIGLILAAGLVAFGVGTAARQRRTAARLREERFIPSDERAYLRGQVRRRLITSVVVVIIGGMIGFAFVSGMERRATDIADRAQKEKEHPPAGPEHDPGRPPDHQPPTDDDREFVKLWGYYWIAVLVLVFVAVCCAVHDFWATRRYWMAQYKLMKADHEAKLRRDLAAYRAAKDNDRMHGRGGNKPDRPDGASDDTDEHPPAG